MSPTWTLNGKKYLKGKVRCERELHEHQRARDGLHGGREVQARKAVHEVVHSFTERRVLNALANLNKRYKYEETRCLGER